MPQGAICSGALGKMAPLIITARKGHNTRTAAGEKVPVDIWCPPGGYNTRTAAGEKVPVPSKGVHTELTAALKCGHRMLKGVKRLSEGAERLSTFNSTRGLL